MSTPSTATALPPIDIANPYQYAPGYGHHSHVGLLNSHPRLAPTVHYNPPSPLYHSSVSSATNTRTASSSMTSRMQPVIPSRHSRPKGRRRTPDWDEFYRNGPPKEIIVIDDSPTPPPSASINGHRQQPIVPSSSRTQYAAANGGPGRHTDKKRRTDANQYEAVYTNNHYASTQTPGGYGSPTTVSAHSSTSINGISTTAGTSLVSNSGSVGAYSAANGSMANPNGKRKRIVTRAGAAAAAGAVDAFASYHPPPRPPIKAKDVYVQQIPDVSSRLSLLQSRHVREASRLCLLPAKQPDLALFSCLSAYANGRPAVQPDRHSQQRVDDNDGHYIVTADTDLTARCT